MVEITNLQMQALAERLDNAFLAKIRLAVRAFDGNTRSNRPEAWITDAIRFAQSLGFVAEGDVEAVVNILLRQQIFVELGISAWLEAVLFDTALATDIRLNSIYSALPPPLRDACFPSACE